MFTANRSKKQVWRKTLCAALVAGFFAAPVIRAQPVDLVIADVAGNLAYTKAIWEAFKKANPQRVGRISYEVSTATALPSKLMAQKKAKRNDIHMVLTGFDALASGQKSGLWLRVLPELEALSPGLTGRLVAGASEAQRLAEGFGVINVFSPSGPFLTFNPSQVRDVPRNLDELKSWISKNPKKFFYARPATSGPGRTFLMALPYMLGDKNPLDPVNGWEKTWAYLREIGQHIEYYTPGTTAQMKEFGQGGRTVTITTAGWDLQMRVLGTIPVETGLAALEKSTFVSDAHFMVIPSTIDDKRKAVVLEMMAFALAPQNQLLTVATGGMYPGPVLKDVDFLKAPKEILNPLLKLRRSEVDQAFRSNPVRPPLPADAMLAAFARWDREIGAGKAAR